MSLESLQYATAEELDKDLPCGLYVVCGDNRQPLIRSHRSAYDAVTDTFRTGDYVLLGRVREFGLIPSEVESITIRSDGKQVIKQWSLQQDLEYL